ncbi:hypothetical protein HAU43_00795 [Weissella confusa]|uniref:Uncharacterized protein n=1 Tax=Weissella confusa TaxID=1583 RepID=A0AAE2S6H9_WEICO|nr:hypothetical protein [Weissella confusa]MBJ7631653.1 hypothetical protein [Weissella confusa]MBJ7644426.1 hypothetical protein [Weissella confusa]
MSSHDIEQTLLNINAAKLSFENVADEKSPIVPAIKIELMHLSNLLSELTE